MTHGMTHRGIAGWKSLLLGLLLALSAGLALALPTSKDVEAAVQAGNMQQAESMLQEVIRAKPDSAKAHYELGQVLNREGRSFEARAELQKAQSLDPSLKFASSPERFRDMLAKLDAALSAGGGQSARPAAAVRAPTNLPVAPAAQAEGSSSGFPWMFGLGVLVVIALAVMFLRRPAAQPMPSPVGAMGNGGSYGPGYGGGNGYPAGPMGGAPGSGLGGVGGAVLGGVAGVAAGYGLARMMERRDDTGGHASTAGGYTAIDSPSGSAPDLGSFDAGSGDSWDSGGGDMGSGGGDGGGGDW